MATAFTHGFVALTLAPLAPKAVPRPALVVVLVLLAVIPDLDVIAFGFGIPYAHPLGHRGFTHSLLFAAVAGVVVTSLFGRYLRSTQDWLTLILLCFSVTLSHGLLDAFTNAGLGVGFFIPFDDSRYFFPWRPIQTSPIGIAAFFNGAAGKILLNELLWVWIPIAVAAILGYGLVHLTRGRSP